MRPRSSPLPDDHYSTYQRSGDDIITVFLDEATLEETGLNRAAGVINACVRGMGKAGQGD